MKLVIQHGHVIDPANNIDQVTNVYIADGKIVALGDTPNGFKADKQIDASGLTVIPGLVDLSARLREPGHGYNATLQSELTAASAGGITSLACPPDTQPVLDETGLVEMLKYRSEKLQLAHVYPIGALTKQLAGTELTEMVGLSQAGCIGFSQAYQAITDTQVMWRAFEYAATFNYTLFLNAEDPYLAKDGVAHDGETASRLGLKGIPTAAESLALATMLRIADETGAKIHVCRLSTAEGVALIRQAKQQGLSITADVSCQHLHLTDLDIAYFDANTHLRPPLRSQRDRTALTQGLLDGTIDAICSDHSPVNDDAKLLPFAEAEIGASSLELLLPLTLKWAQANKISLAKALSLITHHAANIMDINTGSLTIGQTADIAIFDADHYWQVKANQLQSQGKNTPFLNMEVIGKNHYTLLNGEIVFQQN